MTRLTQKILRPVATLFTVLSLLALLTACSKVTNENYRQLRIGMTYPEVVRLLGEPAKCDSLLTARSCTWGSGAKAIDIQFVADQVVLFSSRGL